MSIDHMRNDLIVALNIYPALIIYQACAFIYYLTILQGGTVSLSIVQMKKLRSREVTCPRSHSWKDAELGFYSGPLMVSRAWILGHNAVWWSQLLGALM